MTAFNLSQCPPPGTSCAASATATYTLSSGGNLLTATDSAGRKTTYTYDSSNRITQIQSPAGALVTVTYVGSTTQVASVSNGAGTWTYGYATSGSTMTTTVTDPLNHTRVVQVNTTNNTIISDTNALNQTTSYQYDTYGRPTLVTAPEGDAVQYAYDGRGNVLTTTQMAKPGSGLGNIVTTASYDSTCSYAVKCNQPNATIDARNNETDYTYDTTYGSLLTVTAPATAAGVRPQTRYTYTPTYAYYYNAQGTLSNGPAPINLLTSTSSCQTQSSCAGTADEVKTTLVYGSPSTPNNLLPTSATVAAGSGGPSAIASQTYDGIGNVLTVTGPLGAAQTVAYRYDAARQTVGTVGPSPSEGGLANTAERITYNGDGHVTLDEKGTVASQSNADWANFASAQQVATTYDAQQRPVQTTVSAGGTTLKATQVTYDAANRATCLAVRTNQAAFGALPASACTLGSQGSNGPDQIAYSTYDALNRPSTIVTGYGTSASANYVNYAYTPDGLTQMVADANNNLTTTTFDGFNRTTKVNFPSTAKGSGTSDANNFESYGYDANGNVTSRVLRSGDSLSFTYDALNRATLKHYSNSSLNQDVYLAYDNLGRTLYTRFGSASGPGVVNTYDALGRVTSSTSNGRTLAYGYDAAGNRLQTTYPDTGSNALAIGYAYDNLSRVTSITETANGNTTYTLAQYSYDSLGRRTQVGRGPSGSLAATGYGYDGLDRLSQLVHSFANSGMNLTLGLSRTPSDQLSGKTVSNTSYVYAPSQSSTSYSANGLNQYASVAGTSFSYDGRGNLTSDGARSFTYDLDNHLLSASGPTAVALAYDPLGRLQTTTASGSATSFLYDGDALVAEYDGSGNLLRRYVPGPGSDEPVVWYEGAGTSNRRWLHADDLGSVVAYSDGSANADTTYGYGPYGEPNSWSGSRYRYTGQLMIPEAQLYFYKARVYNPAIGRFMQTDPIGYGDGPNWYAYVHNDPVNGKDPSGHIEGEDDDGHPAAINSGGPTGSGSGTLPDADGGDPIPYRGDPFDAGGVTEIPFGSNPEMPPSSSPDIVVNPPASPGLSAQDVIQISFTGGQPGTARGSGGQGSGPASQNNPKPPCANSMSSKIAGWADKISVGAGAVAVTSGTLGLIAAPSGAGFIGFEAVAAISGGVSALASGVGTVAHFASGDYVGAALDAGGIIGGFAAGRLAGGAIASTRTFNNLTASQVRQVSLLSNATGTSIGAASSLYSCGR